MWFRINCREKNNKDHYASLLVLKLSVKVQIIANKHNFCTGNSFFQDNGKTLELLWLWYNKGQRFYILYGRVIEGKNLCPSVVLRQLSITVTFGSYKSSKNVLENWGIHISIIQPVKNWTCLISGYILCSAKSTWGLLELSNRFNSGAANSGWIFYG